MARNVYDVMISHLRDPHLLEVLADVEHDRWSGWEKYRERCMVEVRRPGDAETHAARWLRQRSTTYAELTEQEKESDRKEARKGIEAIIAHLEMMRGVLP